METINALRKKYEKEGVLNKNEILYRSIKEAGEICLKPVLLTSLTTMLALIPILFLGGIGADLQRPLVWVVVGGLSIGTFFTLWFVPLAYWLVTNYKQPMFYRTINTLSIDISLGAVVGAYFFCLVFGVPPDWISLLVLGSCVWIIYTIDHSLDAKRIVSTPTTFRHQFHQQNFKVLLGITAAIGIVTIILVGLFLNPMAISYGLTLGGVAILYLLGQRFLFYLKETIGAILYTIGILIPSVANSGFAVTNTKSFLILQFFLVVLMNLIMFSSFDKRNDELNKQNSFATRFGATTTNRLVWVVFSLAVAISLVNIFCFVEYSIPSMVILAMVFLLGFIQFFPSYFSQHDRFRYVGDGIFFLPLLYLLF